MDFSDALRLVKDGFRIYRKGWNGKDMWIAIFTPTSLPNQEEFLPFLYIEYPMGHKAYPLGCKVPWLASQTDILANDWEAIT